MSEHLLRAGERKGKIKREREREMAQLTLTETSLFSLAGLIESGMFCTL